MGCSCGTLDRCIGCGQWLCVGGLVVQYLVVRFVAWCVDGGVWQFIHLCPLVGRHLSLVGQAPRHCGGCLCQRQLCGGQHLAGLGSAGRGDVGLARNLCVDWCGVRFGHAGFVVSHASTPPHDGCVSAWQCSSVGL